MYGIKDFSAIINPPQSCIWQSVLANNAPCEERPAGRGDGYDLHSVG